MAWSNAGQGKPYKDLFETIPMNLFLLILMFNLSEKECKLKFLFALVWCRDQDTSDKVVLFLDSSYVSVAVIYYRNQDATKQSKMRKAVF